MEANSKDHAIYTIGVTLAMAAAVGFSFVSAMFGKLDDFHVNVYLATMYRGLVQVLLTVIADIVNVHYLTQQSKSIPNISGPDDSTPEELQSLNIHNDIDTNNTDHDEDNHTQSQKLLKIQQFNDYEFIKIFNYYSWSHTTYWAATSGFYAGLGLTLLYGSIGPLGLGNAIAVSTSYPAFIFIVQYWLLDYIPGTTDIVILISVILGITFVSQPMFIFGSSSDEDESNKSGFELGMWYIVALLVAILQAVAFALLNKMKIETDSFYNPTSSNNNSVQTTQNTTETAQQQQQAQSTDIIDNSTQDTNINTNNTANNASGRRPSIANNANNSNNTNNTNSFVELRKYYKNLDRTLKLKLLIVSVYFQSVSLFICGLFASIIAYQDIPLYAPHNDSNHEITTWIYMNLIPLVGFACVAAVNMSLILIRASIVGVARTMEIVSAYLLQLFFLGNTAFDAWTAVGILLVIAPVIVMVYKDLKHIKKDEEERQLADEISGMQEPSEPPKPRKRRLSVI